MRVFVANYFPVSWVKFLECQVLGGILSQNSALVEGGQDVEEFLFPGKLFDVKKETIAGDACERVPDARVDIGVQVNLRSTLEVHGGLVGA